MVSIGAIIYLVRAPVRSSGEICLKKLILAQYLLSSCGRSVATFPKSGNGPVDDNSIRGRLTGLKWLATDGKSLPAGVERILVMDATDLQDLPLSNDDPNLPVGVDVEEFWKADGRKPSRILLRHGDNAVAIAVAKAAAKVSESRYGWRASY